MTTDNRIRRTFREITSSTKSELPEQLLMYEDGWYGSIAWDEILKSERVLVSAEAGAGKTYECTAQAAALIAAGEPAFYLELTQLASSTVRNLLSPDEARRFDEWETSQTQVATFFLDSIDELRLTTGAFRQAIINVARSLDGRLQRSRIVITTRPIPFDRTVIEKYLPAAQADEVSEEVGDFVDVVTSVRQGVPKKSPHAPMRHVVLLPLTNENISTLAATLGVSEPEQLLSALHEADTLYYARRPQDLIDICSLWRERGRLGSHREQIDTDVRVKLRARNDRAEAAQISDQRAHDAATRLALTMSLTRRLNLRHSAAADIDGAAGTALDPAEVLWDWTQEERQTLLERAFFSFASYGRVRVHHRSVLAYCAALRILTRIGDGASFRSVRRLLFTRTYDGREAIRPSLREPAVWAAQAHSHLCEHVLKCEPYALLSLGDPAQLPLGTIVAAFTAYVDQYGPQRNTGKRLTDTEIRRFASAALAKPILDAWARPILNPEIRIVILAVIDIGRISECADILVSVANDGRRESSERLVAVRAMKGLCDAQLVSMSDQISTDAAAWPYDLAVAAARDLFPRYIGVDLLLALLARPLTVPEESPEIPWGLVECIVTAPLDHSEAERLVSGILSLVEADFAWMDEWDEPTTKRPDLVPVLAAASLNSLGQTQANEIQQSTARAAAIACLLSDDIHLRDGMLRLKAWIGEAKAEIRRAVFWAAHQVRAKHFPRGSGYGGALGGNDARIRLTFEGDGAWLAAEVRDVSVDRDRRDIALHALLQIGWKRTPDRESFFRDLQGALVQDRGLAREIEGWLTPPPPEESDDRTVRRASIERERELENRRRRDQWSELRDEVRDRPEYAFSLARRDATVHSLWVAMRQASPGSREIGWNRRFIERHLGVVVADRLREALMAEWRSRRPTLVSERESTKANSFPSIWLLGLAALYAEAEQDGWAQRLSESDAELALRYVPLELNGFPSWLDALCTSHPGAVERVLGDELTRELDRPVVSGEHLQILQNIGYATEPVARMFVSRVLSWIQRYALLTPPRELAPEVLRRLNKSLEHVLAYGASGQLDSIHATASRILGAGFNRADSEYWFAVILRFQPTRATEMLGEALGERSQDTTALAVRVFAALFGDRASRLSFGIDMSVLPADVLGRLALLAYRHVRPDDDVTHSGVFSPDARYEAERARHALVETLLDAPGEEVWRVKLSTISEPEFAGFRSWALERIRDRAAEDADGVAMTVESAVRYDRTGEAPPKDPADALSVLLDRLDDIDELLLTDESPRETWATIEREFLLRREIARVLQESSRGLYTVSQEAVSADEKEKDIMLSFSQTLHAVIELKLGWKWTGPQLFSAVTEQLLEKYMATPRCPVGCLVVAIVETRHWEHPATRASLSFEELIACLNEHASASQPVGVHVRVRGLDLRQRLGE